jgi:hypothetical protein
MSPAAGSRVSPDNPEGQGRREGTFATSDLLLSASCFPSCQPFVRRSPGRASWASLCRDALRPDTLQPLRSTAQGKDGASWGDGTGATRSHAQACLDRAWRAWRGPTPCPERAPWHPLSRHERQKLSTAQSSSSLKFIDSGPCKSLISLCKEGSIVTKRAAYCD